MRFFSSFLFCLVLAGCASTKEAPEGAPTSPPPSILGAAVETVPLSNPSAPAEGPEGASPVAGQAVPFAASATPPVAAAAPPAAITPAPTAAPAQQRCEARGGIYAASPSGNVFTCLKRTRDGGQRCDQDRDCEGQCLARSQTCAPLDPLLGCNEVLQDDGYVVNLCLN